MCSMFKQDGQLWKCKRIEQVDHDVVVGLAMVICAGENPGQTLVESMSLGSVCGVGDQ